MNILRICSRLSEDQTTYFSRPDKIGPIGIMDKMVERNGLDARFGRIKVDATGNPKTYKCVSSEDWTSPTPAMFGRAPRDLPDSFKARMPDADVEGALYTPDRDTVRVRNDQGTVLRSHQTEIAQVDRIAVTYDGHILIAEQGHVGGRLLLLDPQGTPVARGQIQGNSGGLGILSGALGIAWDPSSDAFTFAVTKHIGMVDLYRYNSETSSIDFLRPLIEKMGHQIQSLTYDASGLLIVCYSGQSVSILSKDGTVLQTLQHADGSPCLGLRAIIDEDGKIVVFEQVGTFESFKITKWDA